MNWLERVSNQKGSGVAFGVVILVCLFTLIVDGLDLKLLPYVNTLIIAEWRVTTLELAPAMAAAMAGMVVGNPIGGLLGDRFGRKPVLATAVLLFGAATAVTGLVQDSTTLTLVRLATGVALGAAVPNILALAAEWTAPAWRPLVLGLVLMGTPLGGIVGAVATSVALPTLGWRGCFYAAGVLTLLLFLIILVTVREPKAVAGPDKPAPETKSAQAAALPLVFSRTYARVNLGVGIAIFANSYCAYAILSWMPYLLSTLGWSLQDAIQSTIYFNVTSLFGAVLGGWCCARFGSRATLYSLLAGVVFAVASIGMAVNADPLGGAVLIRLALALSGLCLSALQVALYAVASHAYPTEGRSGALGLANGFSRLGGAITIFAGGAILSVQGNSGTFFGVAVVAVLATGIGFFIIDRHIPRRAQAAAAV